MNKLLKNPWIAYGLISISSICYYFIGYKVARSDFGLLFGLYTVNFIVFLFLYYSEFQYKLHIGILFRLILIMTIPNLSQDFYRFIWDGRLLLKGVNPYLFTPNQIPNAVFQSQFLIEKMGPLSASHFSNYPPLNQILFAISAFFSPKNIFGNILVLRTLIILADLGIYVFGKKILSGLNLKKSNIYIYFLNPLVIIELTGNLHFEGVMMFFFCLGVFSFFKKNISLSGVFIGFSILIKLIPLMLLPLFFKYTHKYLKFYFVIGITLIVSFLPFVSLDFFKNYSSTIGLWFTNFEFNGSIYYLIRKIGFWITGYNIIGIYGRITPLIIIGIILFYTFKNRQVNEKQILKYFLNILLIYFLISTTVHPWYLVSLIFINVFFETKSVILWSFLIYLSYHSYKVNFFEENYILIIAEYFFLMIIIFFERKFFLEKCKKYFFSLFQTIYKQKTNNKLLL